MKAATYLIITALFLTAALAQAEMYQWVDENGVVTFMDSPPPKSKKRSKVKVYSDSEFAPAPPPEPAPAPGSSKTFKSSAPAPAKPAEKVRFSGAIEMYVTDWCSVCKKAEKYIAAKNYPVVKYDIEKDKSARLRYQELGGRGVPLIMVGSKRMSGFSADLLEQYLGN